MRVDDIARDVGISKRTLYELFRTKLEMAREALERRFERLDEALARVAAEVPDEVARLRQLIVAHARVHGDRSAVLARDIASTPELERLVCESRARCNQYIEALLREAITGGRFRAQLDPKMVRRTLLAAVEGVIDAQVFGDEPASIERAVAAVFDVVVDGLTARPIAARSPAAVAAYTASL